MLVIGNSAVDITQGNSWIYQIADNNPKIVSTVSNEQTHKIFLTEQNKHEQIAIVMSDFVPVSYTHLTLPTNREV